MLAVSPSAFSALEIASKPAFAARLTQDLADRYPHLLPRFPVPVQRAITVNMLGRASRWGLHLQSGLSAFCGYMIAVAADFDTEPSIRAVLASERDRIDIILPELASMVDDDAWSRAARRAPRLNYFVPVDALEQARDDRTVAAIRLALHERPEAGNPKAATARALAYAQRLGIAAVEDAVLICAASLSFYGDRPRWLGELIAERRPAHQTVELMRVRMAIEFGRFL